MSSEIVLSGECNTRTPPLIPVLVGRLEAATLKVVQTVAILDTGMDTARISPSLVQQAGLPKTGEMGDRSVAGLTRQDVFGFDLVIGSQDAIKNGSLEDCWIARGAFASHLPEGLTRPEAVPDLILGRMYLCQGRLAIADDAFEFTLPKKHQTLHTKYSVPG